MKGVIYYMKDVIDTVADDLNKVFSDVCKPKVLKNGLIWFALIMISTRNMTLAYISFGLFIFLYFVQIYRSGKWKNKMREEYKKKIN